MPMAETIRRDPFPYILLSLLTVLGLALFVLPPERPEGVGQGTPDIAFFSHPSCPHCQEQKTFNRYLRARYPELSFVEFDVSLPGNAERLRTALSRRGRPAERLSVPVTLVGPYIVTGFATAETTGVTLERAIQAYIRHDPSLFVDAESDWRSRQAVTVPLLGQVLVGDYSLATLAVLIGLVDGFNPCAMWLLVCLISLIAVLRDRAKIWLLVGSFVLASGVLYFLFLSAWLNAFLLVGYLRPLTIVVGLVAVWLGAVSLRDGLRAQGELSCPVADGEGRQRTMGRMERLVNAPLSWLSVLGVIALAFVVNSVEFACSAALPAIFTHTLSLRVLAGWRYYGYLLLYDFFYMLDDLIIFSLAVLALETTLGSRYLRYCKVLGGLLLLNLGLVLAVRPEWLR